MPTKDSILYVLDLAESISKGYLSDLTAADLLLRPVPGMNHIAWQLGHLLLTEQRFVEMIKPGSSPALPPDFEAGHGRQSFGDDDPGHHLAPADYLRLMQAQRDATKAVLAGLGEDDLAAPGPEGVRQMAPTVGATFLLIGTHVLMHVGQYVPVRRKLGKPIAM